MLPPALCRGLFFFQAEQVADRHAEVVGDLPGCSGIEIFLPPDLQIRDGAPADAQLGTELAGGDAVMGAKRRYAIVYNHR